jgi:hypothetical protein
MCEYYGAGGQKPDPGINDEERIAIKPPVLERHQESDAVGIQPVERRVT